MPSKQAVNPLRNKLRKELRERRRNLTRRYKQFASKRITRLLIRAGWLRRGQRIAVYLATEEELNLQPLIAVAWQRGCKLFVPHIIHSARRQMMFHPFNTDSHLITHRWGMKQLANKSGAIAIATLDAVLVPTVGFDDAGHRLGMGGGFYDRHLARLRRTRSHRPVLIGVAYACQKISAIDVQAHDIQLDAVLTEHALKWF